MKKDQNAASKRYSPNLKKSNIPIMTKRSIHAAVDGQANPRFGEAFMMLNKDTPRPF
jgi:hypothetical protein